MDMKELAKEMLDVAKPKMKEALVEVVDKVVNPKIVDPALDKLKEKIPGLWDDAIIEANRPTLKEALKKAVEAL